jgi:hypothetical protein
MDPTTNARARWLASACLLAVFGLLVARAPWASAGAADAGAQAPDAATCEGGPAAAVNAVTGMQIAVEETMQRMREEQAQVEADPSGWVVLNNRGYNYGPPHPVGIDPELFLGAQPADAPR